MLQERLIEALGADAVKTAPEDLRVYAFDGYTEGRLPAAVVLPASTRDVAAAVKIARDCGEPIVGRGAGTGLCGGAVPVEGGVVVAFARMNRVLAYEPARRRARVQPGLINLDLSRAVAGDGLFYAPDPSSQKISTIGGNIGTNAGGPHCLSYGTTVNHVLALEIVDERGEVFTTDIDRPGYDLTAAFVGSEGTLGLVTSAWVRLLRQPESTRVWLATFQEVDAASDAVSAIIAAGIVPTALEMMDKVATQAVEAAFHAGYPADAEAVLLIEHSGFEDEMNLYESEIARIVRENGANSWRIAHSQAEQDALWAARKGAAGAMGLLAPNYYLQDVCVRRSVLPQALHAVEAIAREYGLITANVFHAGDGNLHPLIAYDKREKKQVEAVIAIGNEILKTAVDLGGTVSGEHGIGFEKREAMTAIYTTEDLATMARVRDVFDPKRAFNPEKISGRHALRRGHERRMTIEGIAELLAQCTRERRVVAIAGGNTLSGMGVPPHPNDQRISTLALNQIVEDAPADLTVAVQSGVTVRNLNIALARHGTMLPFDAPRSTDATVGGTLAAGWVGPRRHLYGRPRDWVIGTIAVLADGTIAHAGGMVVKNVSGYDMSRLYVGSFGTLAVLVQVNLKTLVAPAQARMFHLPLPEGTRERALAQFPHLPVPPSAAFWIRGFHGAVDGEEGTEGRLSVLLEGSESVLKRATRDLRSAMGRAGVPDTRVVDAGARESFERIVDAYTTPLGERSVTYRISAFPDDALPRADALAALAARFELRHDAIADAMNGDLIFRVSDLDARAFGAKIEIFDDALHDEEPRAVVVAGKHPHRASLNLWGELPEGIEHMRALKARFDPANILNPGRFITDF